MPDDRRLARRMQQGDRRAFEEFVDSYGAKVLRLVRRYVDNPSDVEDVTQEVFIDLYRAVPGFRGESTLSTWVYRIAMNHCLKHVQRRRPEGVPLDEGVRAATADPDGDPFRQAARKELGEKVLDAVGALPDLPRHVIVLHELHGLTYEECAEVLGVPVGTVKSRLSNAFRSLRASLAGYVLGDGAGLRPEPIGETSR